MDLIEQLLERQAREDQGARWFRPQAIYQVTDNEFGWLIFTQSTEWIRTRDIKHLLIGQGPYLVDRDTGTAHHIHVVTYSSGLWEELYRRQIKGIQPPDPVAQEVTQVLADQGRLAAMRYLRRQAPALSPAQAKTYLTAISDGNPPPPKLSALTTRPSELDNLPSISQVVI